MDQTTKIYENTTNAPINVVGVGVIEAHNRISVTAQFHAPINLINYPGVIDVLAHEAEHGPAGEPGAGSTKVDVKVDTPVAPAPTNQTEAK